ncbi:MAG: hypothetical protein KME46_25760 [Brasilonema angustatum HA4187-MV1]|jgi:chromosome segregation ATPase|nr:hypothetical protein [Brasilonema angustatum HA4187-MV1]
MKNCPVCNSEYTEGEVTCQICCWDLTPYPLTFVGQLPDAYISKEKVKLNWAREIWVKHQQLPALSAAEITQLQQEKTRLEKVIHQIQSQFAQERSHLQLQIESLNHEKNDLSTKFQLLEQERSQLQSQTETITKEKTKIEQERSHLQNQVAQVTQENERLLQKIETYERKRSQLQATIESSKQQQKHLQDYIKKLETEKSELQNQVNSAQIQLSEIKLRLLNVEQERNHLQEQLQKVQAELKKVNDELKRLRERISSSSSNDNNLWNL